MITMPESHPDAERHCGNQTLDLGHQCLTNGFRTPGISTQNPCNDSPMLCQLGLDLGNWILILYQQCQSTQIQVIKEQVGVRAPCSNNADSQAIGGSNTEPFDFETYTLDNSAPHYTALTWLLKFHSSPQSWVSTLLLEAGLKAVCSCPVSHWFELMVWRKCVSLQTQQTETLVRERSDKPLVVVLMCVLCCVINLIS